VPVTGDELVVLDGGFAGTHVAAGLTFGCRGRHEQLLGRNPAENALNCGIALGMTHDAGHFDLMHGVDQPGRRAGLTEDVTHVGNFRDARAFAAQGLRDLDAEKPLLANFGKRFARKTRFRIGGRGVQCRDVGRGACPRRQIVLPNAENPGCTGNSLRFHRKSPNHLRACRSLRTLCGEARAGTTGINPYILAWRELVHLFE